MTSNNTQFGFYLPKDDLEEFGRVADKERTSKAALLRKCVLEKIKEDSA